MTTDKDAISLPTYVFRQMGKRSALARKNKFKTVDKYNEEMRRIGKLGGRPKKTVKQAIKSFEETP